MKKRLFVSLAAAGLFVVLSTVRAATITEDFSTNPLSRGWQVFGDTSLFRWNESNQNLDVTWDSTHSNSYFCHPLNVTLTRYDDFTLEFDLRLSDIASGVEPGKTGPLQIGTGLLNLAAATSTNFMRGAWGAAPNMAEFAYYTSGYYDYGGFIYPSPASTVPSFIPGTEPHHYAPVFVSVFETELPPNQTVHVQLAYSGGAQTAVLSVTANGLPLGQLAPLVLSDAANSQFSPTDTFRVDTVSISSYSSAGDDYDSVLAHGSVDNLTVITQLQPITRLTGGPATNGLWQAQFFAHSNWRYSLECSSDLDQWTRVTDVVPGSDGFMTLQDATLPSGRAFYRVHAQP
ncbi:MAG: hypothetical protein WCT12_03625 [Verrucomicrobiota bacterium]